MKLNTNKLDTFEKLIKFLNLPFTEKEKDKMIDIFWTKFSKQGGDNK